MTEPRNEELERVIRENPDDANAYAVYGDWLSSRGSPRGELIALQSRGLDAEAKALLEAKREELLGDLIEEYGSRVTDVKWRYGFIEKAKVANTNGREKTDLLEQGLIALLTGPGRFLRELVVGIVRYDGNDYEPISKLLAEHGPFPTRSLYYGDFIYEETELNWSTIGNLAPLYPAVPNLESLTLRSGTMTLGPSIDLPALRELVIISGGVDVESATAIATAAWPKLETLDVMFGSECTKPLRDARALAPLLEDPSRAPALRDLRLKNFVFHRDIVPRLLESKLVRQLHSLDLSLGTLGDREAEELGNAKSVLGHLQALDVSANFITERGMAALAKLGIQIYSGPVDGPHRIIETNDLGQRDYDDPPDPDDPDDDGSRYAAVYE